MGRPLDKPRAKYNMLTPLSEVGRRVDKSGRPQRYFLFKCDCGNEKVIRFHCVTSGETLSCGCHRRLVSKLKITKHGLARTRFHRIWKAMLVRARHKTSSYRRPLGVDRSWERFENFRDDMLGVYIWHVLNFGIKQTTIDRIDNELGYSKKNCRWATRQEQRDNQRPRGFIEKICQPTV